MAAESEITTEEDYSIFLPVDQVAVSDDYKLLDVNTSTMTRNELRSHRKERKKQKTQRKRIATERLKEYQDLFNKGQGYILSSKYQDSVEAGLVRFFRAGYEKYWKDGQPAEDAEILDFLRKLIKKHHLLISGGFILKNMGLTSEERTKPSIDVDIYIPSNAPVKDPEFYNTMAKIFNADLTSKGKWSVNPFITSRARGKTAEHYKKSAIFSVYSYHREKDNPSSPAYGKMDLVRPYEGVNNMGLIRRFDMSICMNWYDGIHLYSMDPAAIFKRGAGHFNPQYNHIIFGDLNNNETMRYRDRLVKYILRGYSIKYMDDETGKFHEFATSQLPNAISRMNYPQRVMYYTAYPHEKPANFNMTLKNKPSMNQRSMNQRSVNQRSVNQRSVNQRSVNQGNEKENQQ